MVASEGQQHNPRLLLDTKNVFASTNVCLAFDPFLMLHCLV